MGRDIGSKTFAWTALLAFIFALPWERNIAIPGIGAAGTLLGMLALIFAVVSLVRGPELSFRRPALLLIAMAAFVAWSLVTFFWSVHPSATLGRAITYAQMLAMMWIVWQLCRTELQRRALMQTYVFGCFVAIGIVFVNFAIGREFHIDSSVERYSFGAGDPNYLAAGLALAIPMAWYLFEGSRSRLLGLVNLAYLPIVLIAIGLTGSRGGFLTAIAALAIVPLSFLRLSAWRQLLLLAAIGGFVYGAFTLLPATNVARLTSIGEDIAERDFANREDIWSAAFQLLVEDRPTSVVGVGAGAFQDAIEPILGERKTSHNAYLSIAVETGAIGLALFLLLFVLAIVPTLQLPAPSRNLCLVVAGALMVAIVPVAWENQKTLWFLLALLTTFRAVVLEPQSRDVRVTGPTKRLKPASETGRA